MTIGVFLPEGIEAEVCADIARRQQLGKNKYGTTVAENKLSLRCWLTHQYEELLDAAIYCKRAIAEIDAQEARKHVKAAAERQKLDVKKNQGGSLKFDCEDFAAKAKELEHISDCTVRQVDGRVEFVTEAYLAKDDGTVERGYAPGYIGMKQLQERGEPLVPGQWLLDPFERGIKDRYRGFTRYATADEIAAHKAGEAA